MGMQTSKPTVSVYRMTARYVATVPETLRRHPEPSQPERIRYRPAMRREYRIHVVAATWLRISSPYGCDRICSRSAVM